MLALAQLQAFKAAIAADAALAAARTAGAHGDIAAYYAADHASQMVWRPSIPVSELNTAITWSEFAALTVQMQNTYQALVTPGFIDATSANVRGAFTTIFAANTASRPALTAIAQRRASRFEALFTTGNVCSLFGYVPTVQDVADAMAS